MLRKLAMILALTGGLTSACAHALGLGDIHVNSRLAQPFSASIPLTSLSEDEADSLRVQVASNEDFERAGIERSDYLSTLHFEVAGSQLKISSDQIAREPVVALLIEARAGKSRVLRSYTVLLDLPNSQAASVPPAPPPQADKTFDGRAAYDGPKHFGPVRSGQTFWSVATRLRPRSDVSMDQTLLALYTANPQAFAGGIDGLLIGSVLIVPSADDMLGVPASEARRQVLALRAAGSTPAAPTKAHVTAPTSTPSPTPTATPAAEPTPPIAPAPPAAEAPTPAAPAAPTAPADAGASTAPADAAAQPAAEPAAASSVEPSAEPTAEAPAATDRSPAAEAPAAGSAAVTPSAPPATPPPVAAVPAFDLSALLAAFTSWLLPADADVIGVIADPTRHPLQFAVLALGLALLLLVLLWLRRRWRDSRYKPPVAPQVDVIPPGALAKTAFIQPASAPQVDVLPPAAAAAAVAVSVATPAPPTEPVPKAVSESAPEAARPIPAASPTEVPTAVPAAGPNAVPNAIPSATPAAAQTPGPALDVRSPDERERGELDEPGVDLDLAASAAADGPQIDALDPLAEADFHLSYGLYDEAVRALRSACTREPERLDLPMKLAETYFAAGRSADFEALAVALKSRLSASDWERLVFMGGQLIPDSPLFAAEPTTPEAAAAAVAPTVPAAAASADDGAHRVEFAIEPLPVPEAKEPKAAADTTHRLEFELSQFDADAPVDTRSWHGPTPADGPKSPPVLDLSSPTLSADDLKQLPDIDPADIDLYEAEPESEIATDDEIGTKLDLARAYLDMGDAEMARTLLSEVAEQGQTAQKAEAQTLLSRLPAAASRVDR